MEPGIHFDPKAPDKDTFVQLKKMDLDSGLLGKLFGSHEFAPTNIAGLVALVTLLAGMVVTFMPTKDVLPSEFWKIISPIITAILGYLFGRKTKDG